MWGAAAGSLFVRAGFGLVLPALPLYIRAHHLLVADLGWAAAVYMAFGIAGMLLLAPLVDRVGPVPSLVAGAAVYAAGGLVLLVAPSQWALLAGRGLQGIAMAVTTPATFAYIARSVGPGRRGSAFGLVASAQMAGFIFGPAAGGIALTLAGTTGPFVVAVGAAVLALGAYALLPPVAALAARDATPQARSGALAQLMRPLLALLAVPWGVGFVAFSVGQQIPMGVYDSVWSLYMFHLGAAPWLVGLSFAVWALPLVFLSPVVGARVPADRVAPWLVVGGMATALAAATYGLLHSPYAVAGVGFLEGTGSAAILPLSQVYLAHRVPAERMAGAQGAAQAIGQGAALLAAVVSGYTFGVRPWLPFAIVSAGAAIGTLWFARMERAGTGAIPIRPEPGLGA